jgi:hypothetical protein
VKRGETAIFSLTPVRNDVGKPAAAAKMTSRDTAAHTMCP